MTATTTAASIAAVIALSACSLPGSSADTGPTPSAAVGASTSGSAAAAPTAASATVDPCTLITKAEADAAFGFSFDEPKTEVKHNVTTCTYNHSGSSLAISVNPSMPKASFDRFKQLYPDAKDLPGIGDGAFQCCGRIFQVLKGSTHLTIATGDGPGIVSDDKLLDLVRTAVSRA